MEQAGEDWPGPDDRAVVNQMKENPQSPHWEACQKRVAYQIYFDMKVPDGLKEEIVQNAMKSVKVALADFRYESRLTTWLVTVVRSRIKDELRRYHRAKVNETSLNALQQDNEGEEADRFEVVAPRTTEDECIIRERLREAILGLQTYAKQHKHAKRNGEILSNFSFGVLNVDPRLFAKRWDKGMVDVLFSYASVFITEKIINLLSVLLVEELPQVYRTLALPGVDSIGHIVGNPYPERAAVFARGDVQIINLGRVFFCYFLRLLNGGMGRRRDLEELVILVEHAWIPILPDTVEP
jgi:RNA polymerase sigma factor (sigma-70 family)